VRQVFSTSDTAWAATAGSETNKPSVPKGGIRMHKKIAMKLKSNLFIRNLAVLFGWIMFIVGNITGLPILVKLLLISTARALP
jgi:hypothetical protein